MRGSLANRWPTQRLAYRLYATSSASAARASRGVVLPIWPKPGAGRDQQERDRRKARSTPRGAGSRRTSRNRARTRRPPRTSSRARAGWRRSRPRLGSVPSTVAARASSRSGDGGQQPLRLTIEDVGRHADVHDGAQCCKRPRRTQFPDDERVELARAFPARPEHERDLAKHDGTSRRSEDVEQDLEADPRRSRTTASSSERRRTKKPLIGSRSVAGTTARPSDIAKRLTNARNRPHSPRLPPSA